MNTGNGTVRTRGRHRLRAHPSGVVIDDPLIDTSEVDPHDVQSLWADLVAEEIEPAHAVAGNHGEHDQAHDEEHEGEHEVEHEEEAPRRRTRIREAATAYRGRDEMADMWMLRGGKTPLLTPAQELVLAKRVERGDRSAAEELVNANVRLVASVARRYLGRGLPLEDLMQEGIIGLLRAVDKYNYRKGYRFSTYATHWIRQAVSRSLANQGRSIRLPAHVVDAIGRVSRVREELFHRLGRPPTRLEVAAEAGIPEKKLIQLLKNATQPVSLEAPVGAEGEARLGDFVPAGEESSPSERAFQFMVREELEHALNTLTPREKEVIVLRFGIGDEEPHTLEDTGRRLHITRERARQIEAKAMEKLRRPHTAGRLHEAIA